MPLRTKCPACGEVDVAPHDITVVECVNAPHLSSRVLHCPQCQVPSQRPADPLTIELLRRNGVQVRFFKVPLEALEPHTGPVICVDDVLDLRLALALPTEQILAALDSAVRAAQGRAA